MSKRDDSFLSCALRETQEEFCDDKPLHTFINCSLDEMPVIVKGILFEYHIYAAQVRSAKR